MRTHLDIRHEGTLGDDDRTRMTFDENSLAFLQGVLTDLYSDKELAVIREISTNARDSHIAAGIDKPIEVELPNGLVRTLIIRDYGVGLSEREVHEHLSKYGWSSKRDDDEAVGMLGLGFKSPLSYTSQFTLVACKDGERVTVLVTRDSDGCGVVQTVHREHTTDPNGVEVQVPVDAYDNFRQKAMDFFRFWEPGTVLVDGEPPNILGEREGEMVLDPDVIISPYLSQDYIVMGNVPYPIDNHKHGRLIPWASRGGHNNAWVMVRVPIGTINFTPAREELMYTERTKDTIHEARQFVTHTTEQMAKYDVECAADHQEALKRAQEWWKIKFDLPLSYKGDSIPHTTIYVNGDLTRTLNSYNIMEAAKKVHTLHLSLLPKAVFVVGWRGNTVTRGFKKKLELLMEYAAVSPRDHNIYICRRDEVSPWARPDQFLNYDEIMAIEVPKEVKVVKPEEIYRLVNNNGTEHRPVPIKVYKKDASGHMVHDPVTREPIVESVMPPAKPTAYVFAGDLIDRHFLRAAFPKVPMAVVYKAQIRRFKEMFPTAVKIDSTYVHDAIADFLAGLDPMTLTMIALQREADESYSRDNNANLLTEVASVLGGALDAIHDPEVRTVLHTVRTSRVGTVIGQWQNLLTVERHYADLMYDELRAKTPFVTTYTAKGKTIMKSPLPPFNEWYQPSKLPRPPKAVREKFGNLFVKYPLLRIVTRGRGLKASEYIKYINDTYLLAEGLHLSRAY